MLILFSRQSDSLCIFVALDADGNDSGVFATEDRRDDLASNLYFESAREGSTVEWAVLLDVERINPGCCGAPLVMVIVRGKGGLVDGLMSLRCIMGVLYPSPFAFGIKGSVALLQEQSVLSKGGG